MWPFLTLYTPTFKRPRQLAACMASVQAQTLAHRIQHVIDPDYEGLGVGGMFARLASRPPKVYGDYVMFLGDDDVLTEPDAVERLQAIAFEAKQPDVVIVSTEKGHHGRLPTAFGEPVCGAIDLNCVVTRRDVWEAHVKDYGSGIYESDFSHVRAMWDAGRRFHDATSLLVSRGAVSAGAAE